jgi:hypothetical protein
VGVLKNLLGTTRDEFGIGVGSAGTKTLRAWVSETGGQPGLRWNDATQQWEHSGDGIAWRPVDFTVEHRTLRQLIHFIASGGPGEGFGVGPYVSEVTYSSIFPLTETWYEDGTKAKRICRWEATYNVNKTFATETWIVYKSDGVNPAARAVDTISYSGLSETGRSRAVTVF